MRLYWVCALLAFGCGRTGFASLSDGDGAELARPIAAYALDEGAGQITSNAGSGGDTLIGILGNNTASNMFDPSWVQGRFGTGLAFDSTDDTVSIQYTPTGYFQSMGTNESITISVWVRLDAPGAADRVIYEIGGESNCATLGVLASGRVRFALRNQNVTERSRLLDSTVSLTTGAWYYVVAMHGPVELTLHVYDESGAQLDRVTAAGAYLWRTGTDGIAIGNNPADNSGLHGVLNAGSEPLNGIVDEIRIYDVTISEQQIEIDRSTPL